MKPWYIGDIPFVFSVQSTQGNAGFPEFLPFRLSVDEADGYFTQCHDAAVEAVLEKAYAQGSVLSGLMEEGGIGQRYAEDYLRFIGSHPRMTHGRVLDIGCGTGYLLSRFKKMGAEVLGLEPGSHGQEGAARHQVQIIRDRFPSTRVQGKFDLISAFCVLEHIINPGRFLNEISAQLADHGWLVLGVPDCEPYMVGGDISFLFHEHWNYFSRWSISRLMRRVFGRDPVVERAGFGGTLYAAVQKNKQSAAAELDSSREEKKAEAFDAFVARSKSRIRCLGKLLEDLWAAGKTVGIYVPGRAVNILSLHRGRIKLEKMRFFDDNPLLHNTFYPGFPIRVESREELVSRPPDSLLIMSNTFCDAIKQQLRKEGISIPMHTWDQLFGSQQDDATTQNRTPAP